MSKVRIVSFMALLLIASLALPLQSQKGSIQGCYQKNTGQVRIVRMSGECTVSELAVVWATNASANAKKKNGGSRTITAIGTLGGTQNLGFAINDRSDVVGSSSLPGDSASHTFLSRQARIFDLAPLNSQDIQTVGPTAINNHGDVASGMVVNGIYRPAIYDSMVRTFTTLGSLGGITPFGFSGVATWVNNKGESVGYSYVNSTTRHAFLHVGGVMSDLGPSGGFSYATGINDNGLIVGAGATTLSGSSHAFLFENGTITDIDPFGGLGPGFSESHADAVNNRGEVVGSGLNSDGVFHGFLYRSGNVIDLGTLPGGRNSYAVGINQSGSIVGMADVPTDDCYPGELPPCHNFKPSAFLYENGVMTDLNSVIPANSGWELVTAFGINSRGQIVGYGMLNGAFRAFVLS